MEGRKDPVGRGGVAGSLGSPERGGLVLLGVNHGPALGDAHHCYAPC